MKARCSASIVFTLGIWSGSTDLDLQELFWLNIYIMKQIVDIEAKKKDVFVISEIIFEAHHY